MLGRRDQLGIAREFSAGRTGRLLVEASARMLRWPGWRGLGPARVGRPVAALVARGVWWHRGSAAAVLAVATLTVAAAALGPLYARAADESILQDQLRQSAPQTGLHVTANVYLGGAGDYRQAARSVPRPGSIRGYDRVVHGLAADPPFYALAAGAQAVVHAPLVWRQGACRHLVLVAGRCPAGPTEAIVSQRTAGSPLYGIRLGSDVDLYQGGSSFASMDSPVAAVTVVGVYRPIDPRAAYWLGQPFFRATPGDASGDDTIDAVFTTRNAFVSYLSAAVPGSVQASFDYPLTPSALRVGDVPSERRAVTDLLSTHRAGAPISASTGLLSVLDAAAHDQHLANVGALLVVIQLALLGLLVLFQVMSEAIEARGDEIAIAKLRVTLLQPTVCFALAEPLVLLAAAVPLGLGLALLVTHVFAAAVLVPGVPVVVTWASVIAAVVAFAGGVLAAGLGGYRTLTRSVLEQWRHTPRGFGYGRLAFAVDVTLGAAATAGLVLLLLTDRHGSGSGSGTSALLAPGLLVCAVALVGVRLVPIGCQWLARRTRASRRVGVFLAVRQVARQPSGLRAGGAVGGRGRAGHLRGGWGVGGGCESRRPGPRRAGRAAGRVGRRRTRRRPDHRNPARGSERAVGDDGRYLVARCQQRDHRTGVGRRFPPLGRRRLRRGRRAIAEPDHWLHPRRGASDQHHRPAGPSPAHRH